MEKAARKTEVGKEKIAPVSSLCDTNRGIGSILIVDDDRTDVRRLSREFAHYNYETLICGTIDDGLFSIRNRHFDIVITELLVGNQSGWAVIEAASACKKEVQVLVLTRYGTLQAAVSAIKLGATEFLSKPTDACEIFAVLGVDGADSGPPVTFIPPEAVRWEHISSVFQHTGRNMSASARLLKMHRRTLQRILARGIHSA